MNDALTSMLLLCDLDDLASWVGRRSFFDEKLWAMSKALCALELLPAVAQSVVDVAVAAAGRAVKCVVLDLDNTVWGGVVGDDGVDGLELGGSTVDRLPERRVAQSASEVSNDDAEEAVIRRPGAYGPVDSVGHGGVVEPANRDVETSRAGAVLTITLEARVQPSKQSPDLTCRPHR